MPGNWEVKFVNGENRDQDQLRSGEVMTLSLPQTVPTILQELSESDYYKTYFQMTVPYLTKAVFNEIVAAVEDKYGSEFYLSKRDPSTLYVMKETSRRAETMVVKCVINDDKWDLIDGFFHQVKYTGLKLSSLAAHIILTVDDMKTHTKHWNDLYNPVSRDGPYLNQSSHADYSELWGALHRVVTALEF